MSIILINKLIKMRSIPHRNSMYSIYVLINKNKDGIVIVQWLFQLCFTEHYNDTDQFKKSQFNINMCENKNYL